MFLLFLKLEKILWKNENEGHGFVGISLAVLPEKEISFGMRGFLRRHDLEDGHQLTQNYNLKGTGFALVSQLFFQNILYICSSGQVTAHNVSDYNLLWKNELKGFGSEDGNTLLPFCNSSITSIIVGLGGYVISLNSMTGQILWTYNLQNTGYGFVSLQQIDSKMIVAGSRGKLFVINPVNGEGIGKNELAGFGYDDICLLSQQFPEMDQQSSNLIMSRDGKNKRYNNNLAY